ncbi:MAG: hydantoinase/oxoprolinase family protein, partial [Actinobacteria bacterium]|nr:hydantoinase/oxoprolinase family protein [Actinomycetota bacterium]
MSARVGIDTGGTFTDLVAHDAETGAWSRAKVPSIPSDPGEALLAAFARAGLALPEVAHAVVGTTVGTNALLERRGARVAYVTTEGFEDIPFIGRGNRRHHYDLHWRKPLPFIERWQTVGVRERIDHRGNPVQPLTEAACADVVERLGALVQREGIEAVAVNLLHAYASSAHELLLAEALSARLPGVPVSLSHEVAPVWREFERGLTTIADAYLRPVLETFVRALDTRLRDSGFRGSLALLRSNGGTQLAERAARAPIQLSLSGLAGGVLAGKRFGLADGPDLITFDMGGTSCDIGVVSAGEHRYAESYEPEFGLPLVFPGIEVTTIGAGGGSVAWLDRGGFLRVGPRSAGAAPGPACYGRGGVEPTVTDANLLLGRLDPETILGGDLRLDSDAAERAVGGLAAALGTGVMEAARAIVAIADENMASAIRVRTVEAGIDPRGYRLVAFGGAGPLHASAVARRLGIGRVIVPPHPGLCSAFGALTADLRSDQLQTVSTRSDLAAPAVLGAIVARLRTAAVEELRAEGFAGDPLLSTRVSLRYLGQNYEHEVELDAGRLTARTLREAFARFQRLHESFYGYRLAGQVVEIVRLAVTAVGPTATPLPAPEHEPAPLRRERPVVAGD